MATIIDSLIVELGLDASGFSKGQKDSVDALNKLEAGAVRSGKEVEAANKKMVEGFAQLRNSVIGLFAAFTAGQGLKSFVESVTEGNAALGRTATNLGISADELSAWQGVAQRTGGSAQGIAGTMMGLNQQMQLLALTGRSQMVPWLRELGVGVQDANGKLKTSPQLLLDIAEAFQRKGLTAAQAQAFGSNLGIDQETINLLTKGRAAVQAYLAELLKDSMTGLEQAATRVGTQLLTELTPALKKVLDGIAAVLEWLQTHRGVAEAIFTAITVAVTVLSAALVGSLLPAIFAVNAGLALTPFGMVLTGLVAIGTAADAVVQHWDEIRASLGATMSWIADKAKIVWDTLHGKFSTGPSKSWDDYYRDEMDALDRKAIAAEAKKEQSGYRVNAGDGGRKPPIGLGSGSDVDKMVAMGWTREQAQGIAANIQAESSGIYTKGGDHGQAYGLAQWHKDRQEQFKKLFGHDIHSSTRDEQLQFIDYELRHGNEQAAGRKLMGANTAADAAYAVSLNYERPQAGESEAQRRAALAATTYGAATTATDYSVTNNATSSSQTNSGGNTNVGTINVSVSTTASDPQAVGQAVGRSARNVLTAAQANSVVG